MDVRNLIKCINADFYCGVPDSQLKQLCDCLYNEYGISEKHIIAANEGNCVGIAAGYHLATGKVPVVYMQNSGIGNVVNPVASLLNNKVYGIPCIFIVGWRGEPGIHDEPQHIFQGEITKVLLELIGLRTFVITPDTTDEEVLRAMEKFQSILADGDSVAFIVKKKALTYDAPVKYTNQYKMVRESVIDKITQYTAEDVIVSTTGKISRELFEIREKYGKGHDRDFLTVGSMGHASSIALGIALQKKDRRIWCIDGDGAAVMHMGSLGVMGAKKPKNVVHIVLNNEAHETVGGMPTVCNTIDLPAVAKACGYPNVYSVSDVDELTSALEKAKDAKELTFIEVKVALGSRADLGRPTTTAKENKKALMKYLEK